MTEQLQIRVHGHESLPALIYLPGLHGDWTLIPAFRAALDRKIRFVEMTYPRSLTWSIPEYAEQIELELLRQGISRGWLLGESFGSQIAWAIVERGFRSENPNLKSDETTFTTEGVVLAGGFVKHPWNWGPGTLRRLVRLMPPAVTNLNLKIYKWYTRLRHRNAAEALACVDAFIARRTELDLSAIRHRLNLLDHYDPRSTAQRAEIPVYYLAGFVDPIVPYPLVRQWLRKNCPGYRGGKTFWHADHNVLATAPAVAADTVFEWITSNWGVNDRELIKMI